MKKFIAIVLGAGAMIACTKTSVSYEPTGEIAISPISSVNKTKTTVTDTKFPSKQVMGVYAYYRDDVANGSASGKFKDAVTYLDNVQFNENTTGVWAGWDGVNETHYPYYWPKNGSLVFAAYSPLKDADNNAAITKHTFTADGTNVTADKFEGTYVQSNLTAKTVDFMWSPVTADSHTKTSNNVTMTFYHAMSWITFQALFTKPEDMATPTNPVFTIKSITLSKVSTKGTYATNASAITWTPSAVADDVKDIVVYTGSQALTADAANVENTANGTLVIPQTIGEDLVATVVYHQEVPGTAKVEQTAVLHLNQCKVKEADLKVWENAKHYTYVLNFTFGTDEEILIDPIVSKWDEVTVDTTVIK